MIEEPRCLAKMEGEHPSNNNSWEGFVKKVLARFQSVLEQMITPLRKLLLGNSEDGVLISQPGVVTLPEDLVETIVAMVPFPFIFKARALSKSWRTRFEPVPTLADEVQKRQAITFQKKVTEWSANWKTFCPVLVDWRHGLLAYDRESQNWVRMLSFLPDDIPNRGRVLPGLREGVQAFGNDLIVTRQQIEGAVLLFSSFHPLGSGWERMERKLRVCLNLVSWCWRHRSPDPDRTPSEWPRDWLSLWRRQAKVHKLTVANLLTRRWKQLPPNPFTKSVDFFETFEYLFEKLVTDASLGTYKVIVFYRRQQTNYVVHIYDSGSNAWRRKSFVSRFTFGLQRPEYVKGVLYMVGWDPKNHILAFNVEHETVEEFEILEDISGKTVTNLVAVNGTLLMVGEGQSDREDWHLLSLDLESRRAFVVSQIPQTAGSPGCLRLFRLFGLYSSTRTFGSTAGDCICYQGEVGGAYGMLVYNQHEDEWSFHQFPESMRVQFVTDSQTSSAYQKSFVLQPNLHPFMAV